MAVYVQKPKKYLVHFRNEPEDCFHEYELSTYEVDILNGLKDVDENGVLIGEVARRARVFNKNLDSHRVQAPLAALAAKKLIKDTKRLIPVSLLMRRFYSTLVDNIVEMTTKPQMA